MGPVPNRNSMEVTHVSPGGEGRQAGGTPGRAAGPQQLGTNLAAHAVQRTGDYAAARAPFNPVDPGSDPKRGHGLGVEPAPVSSRGAGARGLVGVGLSIIFWTCVDQAIDD